LPRAMMSALESQGREGVPRREEVTGTVAHGSGPRPSTSTTAPEYNASPPTKWKRSQHTEDECMAPPHDGEGLALDAALDLVGGGRALRRARPHRPHPPRPVSSTTEPAQRRST
jgi:hypothetical protein